MKLVTDPPAHRPATTAPTRLVYPWLIVMLLVLASAACVLSSPEVLNDGKGTRDNPIPPKTYAHTLAYDVGAMAAVWEQQDDSPASASEDVQLLRVQFQVHCNENEDQVCQLEDIRRDLKLVDASGILYEPVFSLEIEKPLEGEILGGAEKTGWLAFQIPRGVEVVAAIAEYGEDQRVFMRLP